MRSALFKWYRYPAVFALFLILVRPAVSAEPELTREQMKHFLLTAKVVASKQTKKGITNPWRLTLSDGSLTHDAGFQAIDEHKSYMQLSNGDTELNFVDSYKYNVGGYILAELLGIENIMPVYVERKWMGNIGSISWWLPVQMDEEERLQKKISSPNSDVWNAQMYKIRVFDELIYDTDANLTNILVGQDWKPYRIDLSRAFRLFNDVKTTKNLDHCDRQLFAKLRALDAKEFAQKTQNFLNKAEQKALLARRDKIVAYIEKAIAEKGEKEILY